MTYPGTVPSWPIAGKPKADAWSCAANPWPSRKSVIAASAWSPRTHPPVFFRLEPDGDATHLIVDSDYRLPGHLPAVVKDLLSRSLVERTMRETGEKFRALAEATVPAPA